MRQRLLVVLLIFSLGLNCFLLFSYLRRSVVVSVPDGDSLQLADGRRVRLLGLDAPEKGRCLSDEARSMLETMTKGKHVWLKDMVTDDYGRTLANVLVGQKLISIDLVRNGLARFESVGSQYKPSLQEASDYAKEHKLGIYSETCRKTVAPQGCAIKGNIREGKPVYYVPKCTYYDQVIVDEAFGDAWFCSEKEAKAAGFIFAPSC